jgi:head-tail adaptor
MRLDTLISFYEPVLTKSASGHERTQYRKLPLAPDMYAEMNNDLGKSKERDEGKQRVASTTVGFDIRYRGDLNQKMIIQAEGKYYDILKIAPVRRQMFLTIEAEEKDNDWSIDLFTP